MTHVVRQAVDRHRECYRRSPKHVLNECVIDLPMSKTDVPGFIDRLEGPQLQTLQEYFLDSREVLLNHLLGLQGAVTNTEHAQLLRIIDHWAHFDESAPVEQLWDFRLGAERAAIPTSLDLLPDDAREATSRVVRHWELEVDHPIHAEVDMAIVLGGQMPSSIARVQYLGELINTGLLSATTVVGLAGHRALSSEEAGRANAKGLACSTEAEGLLSALDEALPGTGFAVFVAPNLHRSRATTRSALAWLLHSHVAAESIAIVTTSVYRIQSHIDLLCGTEGDVELNTAAVGVQASGLHLRTQHYLQEIKSALDASHRLKTWAKV